MSKTSTSYRKGLLRDLKDTEGAAAYLNAALEDESKEVFMLALRDVADAKGISDLAKKSGLNRENLYRILSEKGNPQLGSLSVLLESMGLKLAVEVKKSKAALHRIKLSLDLSSIFQNTSDSRFNDPAS